MPHSNHDVARHVSRLARPQEGVRGHHLRDLAADADLEVGLRRARAAALLMFALPGSCYVYQGEELGLPEVEDLPDDALQDPTWERSNHTDRGRDGCRVPIPWTPDRTTNFGFSGASPAGAPWLPQPSWFGDFAASGQEGIASSMLELYRAALAMRRAEPALGDGEMAWSGPMPDGAIAFTRDPGFACLVNVSAAPVAVPEGWELLLTSGPLTDGAVPADTTAWFRR